MSDLLKQILVEREQKIIERWRQAIASTYPPETTKFLLNKRDQFGNPVGHAITQESQVLFEGLLEEAETPALAASLDNIIRIRAVQELKPTDAVVFVYLLKDVIREVVADRMNENGLAAELLEFELRIDQLALLAFDTYTACREQLFRIRTGEIKKWSAYMTGGTAGGNDEK